MRNLFLLSKQNQLALFSYFSPTENKLLTTADNVEI